MSCVSLLSFSIPNVNFSPLLMWICLILQLHACGLCREYVHYLEENLHKFGLEHHWGEKDKGVCSGLGAHLEVERKMYRSGRRML